MKMVKSSLRGETSAGTMKASRWATYAAAATATTAGSVATVDANIVYSGVVDRHFGPASFSSARFPLAGGGTLFPTYIGPHSEGPSIGEALFFIQHLADPRAAGSVAGFYALNGPFASKLMAGQSISHRPFVVGSAILAVDFASSALWLQPGTGFVGFRFTGAEGVQYGWARITTDGVQAGNTFTLVDYAVASPGERITAGETGQTSVPESGGSLGLLALGCAGLLAWRAARKLEATP